MSESREAFGAERDAAGAEESDAETAAGIARAFASWASTNRMLLHRDEGDVADLALAFSAGWHIARRLGPAPGSSAAQ